MRIQNGVICDLYLTRRAPPVRIVHRDAVRFPHIPLRKLRSLRSAHKALKLGSRCTVFMNRPSPPNRKNGKSIEDIIAGLCARSSTTCS